MQSNFGTDSTFKASEQITLGAIVALDTANERGILLADAATDAICGVAIGFGKDGSTGDTVRVQSGGFSARVVMSAACNIGDWITATTNGQGIATTTNHDNVIGRAVQAAVNAGDVIEVELLPGTLSHA